jgi:5'-3' exonuclease
MNTVIIDGSNLLFRTYWIAETRPKLINTKGSWTGPVYLFLKSLKTIVDKFPSENVWITWDKKKNYPSTNFRKTLAPDTYKQNRDNEKTLKVHEVHDELQPFLKALGIKQIYPWVLEADDIISWLTCEKHGNGSVIVSVDKDMLQLVTTGVSYYNPIKKKTITYENFEQEVGIRLQDFVWYKALVGDKSDNIDGIAGYGVQRGKKLVEQGYDAIVQTLNEENKQKWFDNLKLVDLHGSYNKEVGEVECYTEQYEEQKNLQPNMKDFAALCEEQEFFSIIKDIEKWKDSFCRSQILTNIINHFI